VRISIIAAFAVAFAATFSVMTHSRTPEIFAAMATWVCIKTSVPIIDVLTGASGTRRFCFCLCLQMALSLRFQAVRNEGYLLQRNS